MGIFLGGGISVLMQPGASPAGAGPAGRTAAHRFVDGGLLEEPSRAPEMRAAQMKDLRLG